VAGFQAPITGRFSAPLDIVEYITARKRLGILDWIGKVEYYEDYDHKQLRRRKAG
jgi:hypothetical protein